MEDVELLEHLKK